jgi:hypothetical protein
MKILRIFIRPAGVTFCDIPLGENHPSMGALWDSWKRDGAVVHDNPATIIPWDCILYVGSYEIPEDLIKKGNAPIPFKPSPLYPVPPAS